MTNVAKVSARFSKSLASRRFRPNQDHQAAGQDDTAFYVVAPLRPSGPFGFEIGRSADGHVTVYGTHSMCRVEPAQISQEGRRSVHCTAAASVKRNRSPVSVARLYNGTAVTLGHDRHMHLISAGVTSAEENRSVCRWYRQQFG